MWLDKERIAVVLKDNDITPKELAEEIGLTPWQLDNILSGKAQADYRTAGSLVRLFGILSVCWAMKDYRKWLPHAIRAVAN